jgi:hypothetical protein
VVTITSYLHRNVLNNIILRWMHDEVHPADASVISRLVNFNNVFVCRYLQALSQKILNGLHPGVLQTRKTQRKGDLKDVVVSHCPYQSPRVKELIRLYRARPENYYLETPFQAVLYFIPRGDGIEYVGSCRVKRVRRLAEKAARKIIDRIFYTIKQHAEALADERARDLGIPREGLVTPPEQMLEEFLRAEARLLEDFRDRRPFPGDDPVVINDVAGIKLVIEDAHQDRLFSLLDRMEDCEVVEKEHHRGKYNATNLLLGYRPSREEILARPLGSATLSFMRAKGFSDEEANRAFGDFVRQGEESVCVEIIISDYEEMMESEIGRCMHEDRIIEQRRQQQYRGCLARNIEYLMVYLFTFATSSRQELHDLPIKLWNRYLPDYFDEIIKDLFQIPRSGLLE